MRASTKRFIWFFGFALYDILHEYVYFVVNGSGWEPKGATAMIWLLVWILPILSFEDDKEKGK